MSARRFRGKTLTAALAEARGALGQDMVLLGSRTTKQGVEVTAGRPQSRKGMRSLFEAMRADRGVERALALDRESIEATSGEHAVLLNLPVARAAASTLARPVDPRAAVDLLALDVLPPAAPLLSEAGSAPRSPMATAAERLELPPDVAARLVSAAGVGDAAWGRLVEFLDHRWPVPAFEGGTLAFLGPAASGRSTLLRGLARSAAARAEGEVVLLRVGFPRRPARADRVEGVTVLAANHPTEVRRHLVGARDAACVLVDLPSVDLESRAERRALARMVGAVERQAPGVPLHAVLPARWSARECVRALESFDSFDLGGVAWTFLDQVADPGTVVATTFRVDRPPSFLHGDPVGLGEQSGAASWESVVEWLSELGPRTDVTKA